MKKINDFKCSSCELVFEEFIEGNTCLCPQCSNPSHKIISPIKFTLDAMSGDFPSATARWAKDHERSAKHRRGREDWGDPVL